MIVGIGIDLIEIQRVRTSLGRTPSLLNRMYTESEQSYCRGRIPSLAARFAAKEAVSKALGSGVRGFTLLDIEIIGDDLGRPSVRLHDRAADRAQLAGVMQVHLSLSTSDTVAAAYAVAEG